MNTQYDALVIWAQRHLYSVLFFAWLASNLSNALPKPDDKTGKIYTTFYAFCQATFGMVPSIFRTLFPTSWAGKFFGSTPNDVERAAPRQ